jgi:sugar O-acyltransferase (sialic acid O-acetyltransferase NeuD family)
MKLDSKVCIVGTGGFGKEALCCLIDSFAGKKYKIGDVTCFMESDENYKEDEIMGVKVIRQSEFDPEGYAAFVAIGDPQLRRKVVGSLPGNTVYTSIIHPSVVMSEWIELGNGSIITAGCILTCQIKIGKHAHLNLHTTVGHYCEIGDFFTSAPAVNVSGDCKFGDCVYFGTNASVRQGVSICDDVTIGMGGVVVKNIKEPGVYVGNPLTKLR